MIIMISYNNCFTLTAVSEIQPDIDQNRELFIHRKGDYAGISHRF